MNRSLKQLGITGVLVGLAFAAAPAFGLVAAADARAPNEAGAAAQALDSTPFLTGISPASGATTGGVAVTISGAGFAGATSVSFGGMAAAFTVYSDNTIVAAAPAHVAGQVYVQVVGPSGVSPVSGSGVFTYGPAFPTTPLVTGISPASSLTMGGSSVTISGSGFTGATSVSFGGSGANFTVYSDNTIVAMVPAHAAGQVYVQVATATGVSPVSGSSVFTYGFAYGTTAVVTGISPASGLTTGGTAVTISGSGFTGATSVAFGGAGTSFTVYSDNTIVAVVPPHAGGQVYVQVATPTGASPATANGIFTYGYAYSAAPAVTGLSPSSGSSSGGTQVVIYGSGFNGVQSVTFGGVAASFSVQSDSAISVTAPAHSAGTVDVNVFGAAGGSASNAAGQFTYVTVVTSNLSYCPQIPLWVDDLTYGSSGGGFYYDPMSGWVWTHERGWHAFAPLLASYPIQPLWVNALGYGSHDGGLFWDPQSGQVWTPERGWHTYAPQGCVGG